MTDWLRRGLLCLGMMLVAAAGGSPPSPADAIADALLREDHVHAELLARAWLADAERAGGSASAPQFAALDALVDVLLDGERVDAGDLDALVRREESMALALEGASSPAHARALLRKASALLLRREYPAFTRTIHEAIATGACAPDSDDPVCADLQLQSGFGLFYLERDPKQGEARVQAQLARLQKAPAADARVLSRALRLRARMLLDGKKLDAAVPAMRAYEEHSRRVFGERSAHRSDALTWLGYALRESGRYADGIEAMQEGLAIAARLRPYRQRLHVDALIALAQNLGIIGDADKARVQFEIALAIEEKHPTANGYLLGLVLNSLGTLHGNQGDFAAASRYFARAVPIYARVFGANSPRALVAQKNLAETLQNLGQLDDAARIYASIVAEHDRDPDAQPGTVALLPYKNFATLRLWQERYVEAEDLYRRFLDLLGDGRDFNEINPRSGTGGLAAALWGQRRHREAFEQARLAQKIAVRARRNALDQLSERQMLAFDRSQHDVGGLAISIAADSGDADLVEQAWQLEMEAAGYVTRALATRLASAGEQASSRPWQAWRTASTALSSARVAAAKSPSAAALAAVDRAQEEVDAAERRLATSGSGPVGRAMRAEQGDLAAIVAGLPDGAVLVRYREISDYTPDRYQRGDITRDGHLFALVNERTRPARVVDLGPLPTLGARIDAWYALVSDPRGDASATSAAARALRVALLDPLLAGAATRRVYIVPSTLIDRVNFAALVDEQDRPLLENGPTFHLLNHERELLRPAPAPAAPRVLLAGAAEGATSVPGVAASDVRAGCTGLTDAHALALPGAAREIEALRALAQGRARSINVLAGAAATETGVRAAMPGQSIIHLATHAFAFDGRCADGSRSIELDPPAGVAATDRTDASSLSALAFLPQAGETGGDGLLTSEEVVTLDLSAADWIVLSACETALGRSDAGEGVFGLRRAFRLAGARTVIMSLWKVEDRATADFMQALYRARMVDRLDAPDAMRAAMRATYDARLARGESVHPFYWGGFVAAGAWR